MILGIIIGILISILIFVAVLICRNPINQAITLAKNIPQVQNKGFIIEPESELDEVRQEIIAKNKKQGKITNLSDLYD